MRLYIITAITLFVLSVLCMTRPWIASMALACSAVIAIAFAPWNSTAGPWTDPESGEGANDDPPVSLARSVTEFERERERAADVCAAARRTGSAPTALITRDAANGGATIDLIA